MKSILEQIEFHVENDVNVIQATKLMLSKQLTVDYWMRVREVAQKQYLKQNNMQSIQYIKTQELLQQKKNLLQNYKDTNRSEGMKGKVREQIGTIREVLQLIGE